MSSYTGYILETFVTLLAVCALAFVVLWGARRVGIGRPTGSIELYGHLPLDGKRSVYLIKVGHAVESARVFVVGVGEAGFAKLGEFPASDLDAPAPGRRVRFHDVLARAIARPDGARDDGQRASRGD